MINVIGSIDCSGTTVEVDPWVPLKITWNPRPQGQPLYLRVSGDEGGELELKVDPHTGVLVQVIVIDAPPSAARRASALCTFEEGSRAPIIDRSMWQLGEGSGYLTPKESIARLVVPLGFVHDEGRMTLAFSDLEPSSCIDCGQVQVGVSVDGILVEISATM